LKKVDLQRAGRWLWTAPALFALVTGCGPKTTNETATAPGNNAPAPNAPAAPSASSGSEGRIVVISNGTSPFWVAVENGMNAAADQLRVKADLMRNDGTVAGQIERLEQVSAQKDIKGIAVSVIDAGSKGVADHLQDLQKKGVYVLTIDSDGPKNARFAYIGANNVAAGEQAGKAAAALAPQGAKVVAFVGTQSAANARERLEGFKKGAGPKFTVVDVMEDGTNQTKAHDNVTAAIQAHPEATMLVGLWSYNAPAIAEEVTRAGKRDHYKIVTFDAEPNTITQLQKGVIDATVVQQPYEYGFQAVQLLHALIDKDQATVKRMVPASGIIEAPCRTVISNPNGPIKTGPNVITFDDLKKYLQEKGLKGT
jgi:ribose transport system substrate-binding protein